MTGSGGYTRVTLVGSARRVDVVLPDDEPIGRLLPEALRLTGERSASPATERRLALLDGQLLQQDLTLADAAIPDGSVVRVVGLAEAPPPPVVLDVTEAVADDLDDRAWRWGPDARRWTATALAAAASVAALALTLDAVTDGSRILLVLVPASLLVVGALVGWLLSPAVGTAVVLSGSATGVYAATTQSTVSVTTMLGWAGLVISCTMLALGVATSMGRGGIIGGAAGLVLLGCWALALETLTAARAAACLAVLSAVLLGLLPRIALVASGLTSLDDRRSRDGTVTRTDVGTALQSAHRGLALAVVVVAGSCLAAGTSLAGSEGIWTTTLAALLAVVLAIRLRAFPLVLEVVALVVGVAGIGYALLLGWLRTDESARAAVVVALVAVAAGCALLPVIRSSPQLRARLRVVTDRIEVVVVVAMVPVLVGVFGVYPRLLDSF